MFIAKTLSFYKRLDVQRALVAHAQGKEVSVKFQTYFSKRPDALYNEGDVMEFAKKKASSFHCSEELWFDPLQIKTGMSASETRELRKGWDLILDIDCPDWELSKLITHLFIKALEEHGIGSVSSKFSGNKGFHIAVPFEAFPEHHGEAEVKDLFPEAPRKIAYYLLDYIKDHHISVEHDSLTFTMGNQQKIRVNKQELARRLDKEPSELFKRVCETCGSDVREAKTRYGYLCASCGFRTVEDERRDVLDCPKCGQFMKEDIIEENNLCECYETYRRDDPRFNPIHVDRLNPLAVVEVDTILIAHRHLYRMPYSFHEKSQLVSLPVKKESVLSLSKDKAKWASPEHADFSIPFLDRTAARPGEAKRLLEEAYNHQLDEHSLLSADEEQEKKEYEIPKEAIPEDYFPPCLKAMLAGLKDGRKRALFTIINFLRGAGWSFEQIEETLLAWNERNEEPLRPVTIKGRLRYEKTKKQPLPPHNCKRYYQDFGVCKPDEFCNRIKNPLQYAKLKAEKAGVIGGKKGGRQKLTEEQKAMRRAFRERKKQAENDS